MILSNNLLPEDHRLIWEQARLHADEIHQKHATHPLWAEAVPEQEPHWDYNTSGLILARARLLTCLLAGLHKAVLKSVKYNKLSEVIQIRRKILPQFWNASLKSCYNILT